MVAAFVHRHGGRLVKRQNILVLINNIKRQIGRFWHCALAFYAYGKLVAALDFFNGFCKNTVFRYSVFGLL